MDEAAPLGIEGFGCLREEFDEAFFATVVREYSLSLLSMILERSCPSLTSDEIAVLSILERAGAADPSPLWCPELGSCLEALKSMNTSRMARGLSQVLFNLASAGIPGDWQIRLDRSAQFHWGGFVLPNAEVVEVQSNGSTALVSLGGDDGCRRLKFEALDDPGRWSGPQGEEIPSLPLAKSQVLLLSTDDIKRFDLPAAQSPTAPVTESGTEPGPMSCLTFLRERLPRSSLWIERVLRYLCLVQSRSGSMQSGSFEGYFGLVYMSRLADVLKTGEMLIHECSHHYLALLSCYAQLTEDDSRLYYSPFVKKERPADRILLAYHAFSNVEVFYRDCASAGIRVPDCRRAVEQMRPELDWVERTLLSEVQLTPTGECIMNSLVSKRLNHEFID